MDALSDFSNFVPQTKPDLYLLVTFRNISAPYSVDCEGAYIEVERENDGYQARWCGTNLDPEVRKM